MAIPKKFSVTPKQENLIIEPILDSITPHVEDLWARFGTSTARLEWVMSPPPRNNVQLFIMGREEPIAIFSIEELKKFPKVESRLIAAFMAYKPPSPTE